MAIMILPLLNSNILVDDKIDSFLIERTVPFYFNLRRAIQVHIGELLV